MRRTGKLILLTLRSAHNFLSPHEKIVGIAVSCIGILGIIARPCRLGGHGVEGPDGEGILIKDVEIGAVLLEHERPEPLFVGSRKVVEVADFYAIVAEHLDPCG